MTTDKKSTIKEDCFAINEYHTDCKCLTEFLCKKGEKCRFYMSNKDYEEKHGETYSQTCYKLDKKMY